MHRLALLLLAMAETTAREQQCQHHINTNNTKVYSGVPK